MLHNRIATELRNHFSTVGPSPQAASSRTAAANPIPTSPDNSGPHLVLAQRTLLPAAPSDVLSRSAFLTDLLATTAHRCAALFAEAAVLILVFGLLDRLLSKGHLELPWIIGIIAGTAALLAASIVTDVSARRWLRAP